MPEETPASLGFYPGCARQGLAPARQQPAIHRLVCFDGVQGVTFRWGCR